MMLPLVAAGFRFTLPLVLGAVATAAALSNAELAVYFYLNPPVQASEFFEAVTLSELFLLVAFVVWLFSEHLRREESRLKQALDELESLMKRGHRLKAIVSDISILPRK